MGGLLFDIAGALAIVSAFAGVMVLVQKWRYRNKKH